MNDRPQAAVSAPAMPNKDGGKDKREGRLNANKKKNKQQKKNIVAFPFVPLFKEKEGGGREDANLNLQNQKESIQLAATAVIDKTFGLINSAMAVVKYHNGTGDDIYRNLKQDDIVERYVLVASDDTSKKYDDTFVHKRHKCDSCRKSPLVGKRYHAINRYNFDLCYECFHRAIELQKKDEEVVERELHTDTCAAEDKIVVFQLAQLDSDKYFVPKKKTIKDIFGPIMSKRDWRENPPLMWKRIANGESANLFLSGSSAGRHKHKPLMTKRNSRVLPQRATAKPQEAQQQSQFSDNTELTKAIEQSFCILKARKEFLGEKGCVVVGTSDYEVENSDRSTETGTIESGYHAIDKGNVSGFPSQLAKETDNCADTKSAANAELSSRRDLAISMENAFDSDGIVVLENEVNQQDGTKSLDTNEEYQFTSPDKGETSGKDFLKQGVDWTEGCKEEYEHVGLPSMGSELCAAKNSKYPGSARCDGKVDVVANMDDKGIDDGSSFSSGNISLPSDEITEPTIEIIDNQGDEEILVLGGIDGGVSTSSKDILVSFSEDEEADSTIEIVENESDRDVLVLDEMNDDDSFTSGGVSEVSSDANYEKLPNPTIEGGDDWCLLDD